MPFSKPQLAVLAGVVVIALLSLVEALQEGSRGMWLTFVSMLMVLALAWNWRRNSRTK